MGYSTPDPDWDYIEPFETLQASEKEIKELIAFIAKQEEASTHSDAWIKSALANIIRDLEEILSLIVL